MSTNLEADKYFLSEIKRRQRYLEGAMSEFMRNRNYPKNDGLPVPDWLTEKHRNLPEDSPIHMNRFNEICDEFDELKEENVELTAAIERAEEYNAKKAAKAGATA